MIDLEVLLRWRLFNLINSWGYVEFGKSAG